MMQQLSSMRVGGTQEAMCCILVAMNHELLTATIVKDMSDHRVTVSTLIQCRVQIAYRDGCDTLALLVSLVALAMFFLNECTLSVCSPDSNHVCVTFSVM
jgi:hypothetical protein